MADYNTPDEDGFWPLIVIDVKKVEGEELPNPRMQLFNDGDGDIPPLSIEELATVMGMGFAQLTLTAIADGLPADHARTFCQGLVHLAEGCAQRVMDGHFAGEVTHWLNSRPVGENDEDPSD